MIGIINTRLTSIFQTLTMDHMHRGKGLVRTVRNRLRATNGADINTSFRAHFKFDR